MNLPLPALPSLEETGTERIDSASRLNARVPHPSRLCEGWDVKFQPSSCPGTDLLTDHNQSHPMLRNPRRKHPRPSPQIRLLPNIPHPPPTLKSNLVQINRHIPRTPPPFENP